MDMTLLAEHEHVLDELFRLLDNGALQPGDVFPAANSLSLQLHVSPSVVLCAQEELQNRGLLLFRDSQFFVAAPYLCRNTRKMNSLSAAMHERGLDVISHIVQQEFCEAAKEPAVALSIPLGARVFHLARIRMLGEIALLEHSFLSADQFPGLEQYDYTKSSLYHVLREQYHTVPSQQDLEFVVEQPNAEEQKLLCLAPSDLLLTQVGYTRNQTGHPMEYSVSKSKGNYFLYESIAEFGNSDAPPLPAQRGKKTGGAQ